MARRYVPVAEVARPHGIKGELRLKVYNDESELLPALVRAGVRRSGAGASSAATPSNVFKLRAKDGAERDVVFTAAHSVVKALLVKIEEIDDRDAAEALRDAQILVPRDAFPPLEPGEFYACDLEGARALIGGEEVGRIQGMTSYPTCDVLVLERPGGLLEVPLTDAFVASIDAEAGVVELVTLEGLG